MREYDLQQLGGIIMTQKVTQKRIVSFVMAFVMLVLMFPVTTAYATTNETAWAIAGTNKTVYKYMYLTTQIGTIYADEGFTILATEDNAYYVSYSTSNGEKKGYISKDNVTARFSNTVAGRITANSTVYYGESSSKYSVVGTVYTDEYVAIISKRSGWCYIEYNTSTSGRKRGFIPASNVSAFEGNKALAEFPVFDSQLGQATYSGNLNIYRGPGLQYQVLDNLNGKTYIRYNSALNINGRAWRYVEYYENGSSGAMRTGYAMF